MVVGGAADINAFKISAESGLVGPAAVVVGSAFVFNTVVTDASAMAVFTTRNLKMVQDNFKS